MELLCLPYVRTLVITSKYEVAVDEFHTVRHIANKNEFEKQNMTQKLESTYRNKDFFPLCFQMTL